jgi:phosphonate transport system permease protein
LIEQLSNITPDQVNEARSRLPTRAFQRPVLQRLLVISGWVLFTAVLIYTLVDFGFTLERIAYGLGKLGHVLNFMFPPFLYNDLAGWTEIIYAIAETVAMAFMGTLMASIASRAKFIHRCSGMNQKHLSGTVQRRRPIEIFNRKHQPNHH